MPDTSILAQPMAGVMFGKTRADVQEKGLKMDVTLSMLMHRNWTFLRWIFSNISDKIRMYGLLTLQSEKHHTTEYQIYVTETSCSSWRNMVLQNLCPNHTRMFCPSFGFHFRSVDPFALKSHWPKSLPYITAYETSNIFWLWSIFMCKWKTTSSKQTSLVYRRCAHVVALEHMLTYHYVVLFGERSVSEIGEDIWVGYARPSRRTRCPVCNSTPAA